MNLCMFAFMHILQNVHTVSTQCQMHVISGSHTLQTCIRLTLPELGPTYLDEGESGSWLQRLVFMLHLISHVLLNSFFLVELPLCYHVEEGAGGHGDGDSIPGFGLREVDGKAETLYICVCL